LEDFWGLWGHSYHKLVPTDYFRNHPEYFAFFNGKRRPNQLCLSNRHVLEISLATLNAMFKENPHAKYWSISPNDDIGHCECDLCKEINIAEGGPQGTLIQFINKIAEKFPDKTFTTLAYGSTRKPTLITKPKQNVIIFLSNIEAYRNKSVSIEKSANDFRKNLDGWLHKTPNVFIWDYYTQFTNFLAPFPDELNLAENINFYKTKETKGIFAQLGGETFVYHNDLKTYIIAKKLWNSHLKNDDLLDEFLNDYYGKSAPFIKDYIIKIEQYLEKSNRKLDIYGNPVNEYNSYLNPVIMEEFSILFDKAEQVADNEKISERIRKLRLSFDYVFLQQARFYGREKNGIFTKNDNGKTIIKKDIIQRVKRFGKQAKTLGADKISEEKNTIDDYLQEWNEIFKNGAIENLAIGSKISFERNWIPDYPAKYERTLIDGMQGFKDYSYNWLLFDSENTITVDLKEMKKVNSISPSFLEDQRHWIFLPCKIQLFVSADGISYEKPVTKEIETFENYSITSKKLTFDVLNNIRYIKLKIKPLSELPDWKIQRHKKPLIAIDEIWVN
ncbi:MAG: DUF4838 domain-containing protein, partial [Cloacibacterium sp.]|nr:DUF4838 domain-containing protein [Cloacibacterium sp.]